MIVLATTYSCSNDAQKVILKVDDATGLSTNQNILIKGKKVGIISDITLNSEGNVFIHLNISKDVSLPIDSKFEIQNIDFIGTKGITITMGNEPTLISLNDTLYGIEKPLELDTISDRFKEFIYEINGLNRQDSILQELKRLNENLEQAQNK